MDVGTLDKAVRAAVAAGDGDALHALAGQPASKVCAHQVPWLHRILDVPRARGSVRVLRCTACEGRLYLQKQRGAASVPNGLSIDLTLEEQRTYVQSRLSGASVPPGPLPAPTPRTASRASR